MEALAPITSLVASRWDCFPHVLPLHHMTANQLSGLVVNRVVVVDEAELHVVLEVAERSSTRQCSL